MPRAKKENTESKEERKKKRRTKQEGEKKSGSEQSQDVDQTSVVLSAYTKYEDDISMRDMQTAISEFQELEADKPEVKEETEEQIDQKASEVDQKATEEKGETEKKDEQETTEEEERPKKYVIKEKMPEELEKIIHSKDGEEKYILLNEISAKSISELIKIADALGVPDPGSLRRQELITAIMEIAYNYGIKLYAEGVLQQIESGVGFLRLAHNNYLQSSDDVFVSKQLIKRYGLRSGDVVFGEIKPPEDESKGKYFSLQNIKSVNFYEPWKSRERTLFENLIPYYPTKKFKLDIQFDGDISCRVVDLIAPIGKGQRGLIVSPPRAGKTMLMQNLAKAILTNHPEVIVIVLLIDERPEEVTDWKKNILSRFKDRNIEVVAATFDEKPEIHIKVAEITLAKAKRLVEYGYDVVIFLDSITRLTRAYNQYVPSSGKVLTGGIDSAALQFPKKFFGAARAIEDGGSLTIIATCLIDTGSRMDEVIFEEFKGTGNMEIYLDRRIAEKRIFPAIDVHRSGTRKEELLIPPDFLPKVWLLRKVLQPLSTIDAMELIYEKVSQTKNNEELLQQMILSTGEISS